MEAKVLRLSIIIPVFNSEETLDKCLDAIFNFKDSHDEVIVIDDNSTDSSRDIASKYDLHLILMSQNQGQGHCRNRGINAAKNELLVFIDSDIEIQKDSLALIKEHFLKNGEVSCVTGRLSARSPIPDFFSTYKNLYMNYIFSKSVNPINFLFGSICAFKAKANLLWPEEFNFGEDTELGIEAVEKGLVIHFLENLEVLHYHKKTATSSIRNDFMIPFGFAKVFLLHKKWKTLYSHENFSHVPKFQIISLLLIGLLITSFAVSRSLALSSLALWGLINADFFRFILKRTVKSYVLKAILWTFVDQLIMLLGVFFGFLFNLGLIFKKN
jgi:glycosyltransferase involved in cell wall biosynthesis